MRPLTFSSLANILPSYNFCSAIVLLWFLNNVCLLSKSPRSHHPSIRSSSVLRRDPVRAGATAAASSCLGVPGTALAVSTGTGGMGGSEVSGSGIGRGARFAVDLFVLFIPAAAAVEGGGGGETIGWR